MFRKARVFPNTLNPNQLDSYTKYSLKLIDYPVTLYPNVDVIRRRSQFGFTVQMAHDSNKLGQESRGGPLGQTQGTEVRLASASGCSLNIMSGVSCTGQLIMNQRKNVFVARLYWNMLYTAHISYIYK